MTTVYHMDADNAYGEKSRRELRKNATNYIKQIQEVTFHETASLRPHTSHLRNHQNKTKSPLKSKDELISDVFLWIPSHRRACVG